MVMPTRDTYINEFTRSTMDICQGKKPKAFKPGLRKSAAVGPIGTVEPKSPKVK